MRCCRRRGEGGAGDDGVAAERAGGDGVPAHHLQQSERVQPRHRQHHPAGAVSPYCQQSAARYTRDISQANGMTLELIPGQSLLISEPLRKKMKIASNSLV